MAIKTAEYARYNLANCLRPYIFSLFANSAEVLTLRDFNFNLQNIIDAQGFALSITGMVIVFTALALITITIALLPRILEILAAILPAEDDHRAPPPRTAPAPDAPAATDDNAAVVAAIGYVLHARAHK